MEPNYPKTQGTVPPLGGIATSGSLQYVDGGNGTPVKIDINGTIDKGFFLSEGEWTCYRRNYFSCVCSYSLSPHYPNTSLQYIPSSASPGQMYTVHGFAMSISAAVADNDGHTIDLVQHTPKRDKGPTARPEKVRLAPKAAQTAHHHHHHHHVYGHDTVMSGTGRGMYGGDSFGQSSSQTSFQTEHTFERIQFKQATANNGKRRAAQQYYHLLVELFVDLGTQVPDQFARVAYRKSAKMIVRGRSPGHYQTERRGSTSSGPGGSAGSIGGSASYSQMANPDFSTPALYPGGSDFARGGMYGAGRHQHAHLPVEPMVPAEEAKAITTKDEYQYYPGAIYEESHGQDQDPRNNQVEMFSHHPPQHRSDQPNRMPQMPQSYDSDSKIKAEYDSGMRPSIYHPGPLVVSRRCGQFEGKPGSVGYYPMVSPSGVNINITNIT